MNRIPAVLGVSALLLVACGGGDGSDGAPPALDVPDRWAEAAQRITPGLIRDAVADIASDEMEGRGPGTRGDLRAREYLVGRMKRLGLEPGAQDGGWLQRFDIVGMRTLLPESWVFRAPDGREVSFRFGDDAMGSTGVQQPQVSVKDAEVVFVGYGIQAPEQNWDDFKGGDLSGKILLLLNDDPDWDESLFAGERKLYYGRWTYKYESAARQGAAGAILIHTTPSAGYGWEVVRSSWSGEQFEVPAGGEPRVALQAWLTEESAAALVSLAGRNLEDLVASARSRDFRPVPLDVRTSIRFDVSLRRAETANVIGLLPGSGRSGAGEVLVYSAHHDHLGLGEPDAAGDRIYNGALDNGVAVAQTLAVAEAFTALPERPRRSVMFLFVAAEEQGLLGSRYYTLHPTFPPGKIVANINFELGNVWGRARDVTVFGMGKSTLEDLLVAAAREQGRTVHAEKSVRAGWYYRSDQFSFARIGVPSIWFRSGTDFVDRPEGWGDEVFADWIRQHYHRPTDEVRDDWNYEGLVEDARLGFRLGLAVAGSQDGPAWYPGDEFESVRLKSLALSGDPRPGGEAED